MDPSDLCLIHSTRSSWTGECAKCCFGFCEATGISSSVRKDLHMTYDLADFPCSHCEHSVECMIVNGYQWRLQMTPPYKTYVPFHDRLIEIWETKPKQCWLGMWSSTWTCACLGSRRVSSLTFWRSLRWTFAEDEMAAGRCPAELQAQAGVEPSEQETMFLYVCLLALPFLHEKKTTVPILFDCMIL